MGFLFVFFLTCMLLVFSANVEILSPPVYSDVEVQVDEGSSVLCSPVE